MDIFSGFLRGPRVRVSPVGKSRTKQSFREESEINNIMARYVKTGIVDHLSKFGGDYGFATDVDFHSAMNIVVKADQMFDALPAEIRRRFNGDPGEFLEFVQNPENQEELIELGLAKRVKAEREPVVAPDAAPAAPITPDVSPEVPDEVLPASESAPEA